MSLNWMLKHYVSLLWPLGSCIEESRNHTTRQAWQHPVQIQIMYWFHPLVPGGPEMLSLPPTICWWSVLTWSALTIHNMRCAAGMLVFQNTYEKADKVICHDGTALLSLVVIIRNDWNRWGQADCHFTPWLLAVGIKKGKDWQKLGQGRLPCHSMGSRAIGPRWTLRERGQISLD